ncbi:transcriptional regulator, pbsX family [Streptococcus pyogenes MGAS9429]|uniref:Transcriptional regulator, pbsX family n=1 Tax=Streptococcus pyogenes serotype M12 (strain MGAS9429) TaxID=370551 RepID=Q1JJY7_STRPC|nr:transcriptional regulator, pbsX family [Streptococcus pyogenes MGAS9429]
MKNLKLKAARAGKDLSQQALADLVGVSRQTIAAVKKVITTQRLIFALPFVECLIRL